MKRIPPLGPDAKGDNDYALPPETGADVWIRCGPLSICLHVTDEGVVCDIWPAYPEDAEPIASAYAFFTEADEATA